MKSRTLTSLALAAMLVGVAGCMTEKQKVEESTFNETCGPRNVSVYFDQWDATLNKAARGIVSTLQGSLKGCKIVSVRIIGLADAVGDEQANLQISQERADTIAKVLAKGGWPRNTFNIVAIGDKDATRSDGTMKPMRRRAQIIVEATNF